MLAQPVLDDISADDFLDLSEFRCTSCGRIVADLGGWGRCPGCDKDVPFDFREDSAAELLHIMRRLGVPRAPWSWGWCYLDGEQVDSRWAGWHAEAWWVWAGSLGYPEDEIYTWRYVQPSVLDPEPLSCFLTEEGYVPTAKVVLRWRIWKRGVPGFIVQWWEPGFGLRHTIRDLDANHAREAQALLGVLRTPGQPGRPPGIRNYSGDEFRSRLRDVCREWQANNPGRPLRKLTQLKAAGEVRLSEATFRRYLRDYDVPWPLTEELLNGF